MKYVVTGGAGLIGSSIIWKLNQLGIDDILVVDHLSSSEKWKNLRALSYADYMEKECFMEKLSAGALPRDIECVIHMGEYFFFCHGKFLSCISFTVSV